MWGTSLSEDKLAGDLGNVIEGTSISGRRSDFFAAEKLTPSYLGLLQQYLPGADVSRCSNVLRLLDHLVGASKDSGWDCQPERARRLEIDHHLEGCW